MMNTTGKIFQSRWLGKKMLYRGNFAGFEFNCYNKNTGLSFPMLSQRSLIRKVPINATSSRNLSRREKHDGS